MSRGPVQSPYSIRGQKSGRTGRQRLADIPADEYGDAEMPSWLDREGRAFWRRNARTLARLGLLTGLDATSFALLADSWSRLHAMERQIQKEGEILTGPRGGVKRHPLASIRDRLRRSVFEQMQAFGLSPLSRARIQVTPPRPVRLVAPMEELLDRPRRQQGDDPRDVLRHDSNPAQS
jgi:P27 family predicted phage terminase small subunit